MTLGLPGLMQKNKPKTEVIAWGPLLSSLDVSLEILIQIPLCFSEFALEAPRSGLDSAFDFETSVSG